MKNIAKVFVYVITILSIGTFKAQKTPPKKMHVSSRSMEATRLQNE